MPKIRTKQTPNSLWLRQRELGVKFPLGHSDDFHKTLYSSIQPITSWDHGDNLTAARHGGVFNLEYSPDGLVRIYQYVIPHEPLKSQVKSINMLYILKTVCIKNRSIEILKKYGCSHFTFDITDPSYWQHAKRRVF